MQKDVFVALGGGNEIGASCYFLSIGDIKMILDCGIRKGESRYPNFQFLQENNHIENFAQINATIISHSHNDHFAALPYLRQSGVQRIIATTETKKELLLKLQILHDNSFFDCNSSYFNMKHTIIGYAIR